MAGKTKRMSTIKQLLRLHLQDVSNRKIAEQIGIYKGTRYIQYGRCLHHDWRWNLDDLRNQGQESRFYRAPSYR